MNYIVGIFLLFCLYTLIIWAPVSVYHEGKCLELGYPKSSTTIGLTGYCLGYQGVVAPQVHKL